MMAQAKPNLNFYEYLKQAGVTASAVAKMKTDKV
jgi:hypothetical protein